jgi:hypothetical protein
MRRGRKAPEKGAPASLTISRELFELAKEKLEGDALGYLSDTAQEEPKRFLARLEAVCGAMETLVRLGELAGVAPSEETGEPTADAMLAAVRAHLALENKT